MTSYSPPSSNSPSPPSESTLFSDDTLIPDDVQSKHEQLHQPSPRWLPTYLGQHSQLNETLNPEHYTDHGRSHSKEQSSSRQQATTSFEPINTDYESSAAEDCESYSSIKYKNAEYALLAYCRTNKLEKLRGLLDAHGRGEFPLDINFRGQQKQNFSWTALHLASYFGHTEIVRILLLYQDIDLNLRTTSGDTCLHKASLTNRAQIVQLLLSKGANVLIKNFDGLLAKQLTNDKHILEMLEAAEQVDKYRARQEIFKTVENGKLELLKIRLQEFLDNYGPFEEQNPNDLPEDENKPSTSSTTTSITPSQVTSRDMLEDDRGNTLLHIAALRDYKAICVYLLEQGLDPYKKNHLGESCIDLSSYQLRQLFTSVKPANNRLKRLSNSRVSRFEGPLMKKVRILGWRQIYVVLENGCILLFNNRMDSMNKSRKGYKYLESATCEPDPNESGIFSVNFSDKSRATFLVPTDQLSNYSSLKLVNQQHNGPSAQMSQLELVRQKWIDSIRDHIKYSTDFIRNGLKLNDYDDEDNEIFRDSNANLDQLLIEKVKSVLHEARAHYNILERHTNSLCSLIQSINSCNRLGNAMDMSEQEPEVSESSQSFAQQSSSSASNTGSRILNFIRPSRQSNVPSQSQTLVNSSYRKRNNSLTSEFLDNSHSIMFHLGLLMESAVNCRNSTQEAISLIDNSGFDAKIKHQNERIRVLEDSLQALARESFELEKSLSESQLYRSATSIETEYFDAFENFDSQIYRNQSGNFDDEKTITPESSMPSDEDLNRKIQDVLDEPSLEHNGMSNYDDDDNHEEEEDNTDQEDDNEEADLLSNCSALTVCTESEIILDGNKRQVRNLATSANAQVSFNPPATTDTTTSAGLYKHR